MPGVDSPREMIVLAAQALVAQIDQVTRWLPTRGPHRRDLMRDVTEVEQQIARETPSRGAILNLQVHVWGLPASPLRTVLSRRVAELGQLYGFQSR
jgi:hypothetical protein